MTMTRTSEEQLVFFAEEILKRYKIEFMEIENDDEDPIQGRS